MIFLRATNNKKKLREIERILSSLGHSAVSLSRRRVDSRPEETGETFRENALIKARDAALKSKMPTISDDSGLCVDRLGGLPGVRTARYAGEDATDGENIDKLLLSLKDTADPDRGAAFVSRVCLYLPFEKADGKKFVCPPGFTADFAPGADFPRGAYVVCRGISRGFIAKERMGSDGFGYDPVFTVNGRSYAMMSRREKDALSHRGAALSKLEKVIAATDFSGFDF